ncbi:hypothetical protein DMH04_14235 [Kibdelosporangium aridum]|uniref:Uncharacterized protein n=1 Tax=Kibdelosporangium aridum TaxID=2030 RepID=A0A428ZE49_KIBAR|nr:hypothetical protein DMH04_14235 [Kibdelosporangium aridum]
MHDFRADRAKTPFSPHAGKAAIVPAFRAMFAPFETFTSELTGVYPAGDSDAVCVEYRNRQELPARLRRLIPVPTSRSHGWPP